MIERTAKAAALLGGVVTVVITLLISFDVLMRYFLDAPQLFVDELEAICKSSSSSAVSRTRSCRVVMCGSIY